MVKILRTTGGKNRKVQNHTVDYCGTWKTKGWGRGGWEGGSVVSSFLTPGQDTADRDLGALEATPEQHGLRGGKEDWRYRATDSSRKLVYSQAKDRRNPVTWEGGRDSHPHHHHLPGPAPSSVPGTRHGLSEGGLK